LVEIAREDGSTEGGPLLSLSLLGPFRAVLGGAEIRLRNRKARAVLGCLALSETGGASRERLVGLLWSESPEDKARASLRQVVHELREALPESLLRTGRLDIALAREAVGLDTERLLRSIEAGELDPALHEVPRIAETLFEGLDDLDPAFGAWLRPRRIALHERMTSGLESLLAAGAQRRAVARALLNLDPTHEEACRQFMLSAAEEGDVAAALRAYEALWNVLDEDFDMEPSDATQEVVAAIKSGRILPAAAPRPVAGADGKAARMALLIEPFAAHGVPEDRAHLVHGFRHDLLASLVRFREWFVLDGGQIPAATATFGRVSSRYAVGATAYQAGARISLVVTIRDADHGLVIWSERSDLDLAIWFEAQQKLVRSIVASLSGQVSAARLANLPGAKGLHGEASLAAHDRWLLGQAVLRGFSGDRYTQARALFQQSIKEDPGFSPAYSSLAQSNNSHHIANPGHLRTREREALALELARRAVQIDANDSRAQLVLGWALAMAGQHGRATPHMELARELNPNDSWTLISSALFHAFSARHEEARRLADQALEMTLAPSPTLWGYQAVVAYLRGDDRATIEACDRSEDVIRTLPAWRAAALHNIGDTAGARRDAARFFELVRAAWVGPGPATEAAMGHWLLHQYPFSTEENWDRLLRGAAGAGIPAAGLTFGNW
jgi:DNA-binding SARP family transcriptional activator/Flp pilus assembly protein TadD